MVSRSTAAWPATVPRLPTPLGRLLRTGVALAVIGQAAGEFVHRRAAAGQPTEPLPHPLALVVLGYPSRRSGADHPVQRWRVAQALRAAERHGADVVVFCGAAVRNQWVEADRMAERALRLGLDPELVDREAASSSTWENVQEAARRVPHAASVLIVSDALHATRARRFWIEQRPGDRDRVAIADLGPWYSGWWMKAPTALLELSRLLEQRGRHRGGGRSNATTR